MSPTGSPMAAPAASPHPNSSPRESGASMHPHPFASHGWYDAAPINPPRSADAAVVMSVVLATWR